MFKNLKIEFKRLYWLYLLASCWYGLGLIGLISLPIIWSQNPSESSILLHILALFPWLASIIILLFTIKDLIRRKSGDGLLAALHVICALASLLLWYTLGGETIHPGLKIIPSPPLAYIVLGAVVGVLTFGIVFTSFTPILCTLICLKIIERHPVVSHKRLLAVFFVLWPGWLIVLLTGFVIGNE